VGLRCIFLTLKQIVNQINIFFCTELRGWPVSLLTVPVFLSFFSSLLMLLFVYSLFGNSCINSVTFYVLLINTNFYQISSSSLKIMFTNAEMTFAMMYC